LFKITNHDCPGDDLLVLGVAFDSVVEGDRVHYVQQLTLVLVDAFHLKNIIFKIILKLGLKNSKQIH
jgi:hypothetical protein